MVLLPLSNSPDEHMFPVRRHRGTPKLLSKTASCGPFPPVGGLDTGDELIGAADGLSDGNDVGRGVGFALGLPDGLTEGDNVGRRVGLALGLPDGLADGEALGDEEGNSDGAADGFPEGLVEGEAVGLTVGAVDTGAGDTDVVVVVVVVVVVELVGFFIGAVEVGCKLGG